MTSRSQFNCTVKWDQNVSAERIKRQQKHTKRPSPHTDNLGYAVLFMLFWLRSMRILQPFLLPCWRQLLQILLFFVMWWTQNIETTGDFARTEKSMFEQIVIVRTVHRIYLVIGLQLQRSSFQKSFWSRGNEKGQIIRLKRTKPYFGGIRCCPWMSATIFVTKTKGDVSHIYAFHINKVSINEKIHSEDSNGLKLFSVNCSYS